jgi:uncharacterized membrane protein YphA (DoxX/SURF4 family)
MTKGIEGAFILRLFFGIAFIVAGLDKLLSYGMAKGMFESMFGGIGGIVLILAILIELGGGLALLVGYHTRKAAWLLAILIVVALFKTWKIGDASGVGMLREIMVMNTGGGNTAVNFAYLGALLSLAFSGSKYKAMRAE